MPKQIDRKMCHKHFESHPKLHTSANSNFSKHSSLQQSRQKLDFRFWYANKIFANHYLLKLGIGISLKKNYLCNDEHFSRSVCGRWVPFVFIGRCRKELGTVDRVGGIFALFMHLTRFLTYQMFECSVPLG